MIRKFPFVGRVPGLSCCKKIGAKRLEGERKSLAGKLKLICLVKCRERRKRYTCGGKWAYGKLEALKYVWRKRGDKKGI